MNSRREVWEDLFWKDSCNLHFLKAKLFNPESEAKIYP